MPVDVVTTIEIARPRAAVAAFAAGPDNATAWYRAIESVEWETLRPLAVGSRLAFVAGFLGRRLAYTYEVRELVPGEPSGFPKVGAPMMAGAMRRANRKDLSQLEALLER